MKLRAAFSSKLCNIIFFNLMWVGLVIGRESLLGLTVPMVLIYSAILVFIEIIKIQQLLVPAALGIAIDSILTMLGIFDFGDTTLLIPLWLITLWIAFSTTLTQSLKFVGNNWLVTVTSGAIVLPFNYAVGERLGAVTFAENYFLTVFIIGIIWSVCLPLLFASTDESFKKKFTA